MRVISGKFKGRKIVSPHGKVRPTSDMVKGSLFSILENRDAVYGARCLDVFCGTGSLGIEALSRGAVSCVFVDADTSNAKANTDKLGLNVRFIKADYKRALKMLKGEKYDLIFCDPPYDSGFCENVLNTVRTFDMLAENGTIIIEHSSKNDLINLPENCIIDHRVFGVTALDIIMRGDNGSDSCGNV